MCLFNLFKKKQQPEPSEEVNNNFWSDDTWKGNFDFCYDNYEKVEVNKSKMPWDFIDYIVGVDDPYFEYSEDDTCWIVFNNHYEGENDNDEVFAVIVFAWNGDTEEVISKEFYAVSRDKIESKEKELWSKCEELYHFYSDEDTDTEESSMIIGKEADIITAEVFEKIITGVTQINPIYEELEQRLQLDGEPWTEKITDPNDDSILSTLGHLTEYEINGENTTSFLLLLTDLDGIIVGKYLLKMDESVYLIRQRLFEGIQEAAVDILKK